VQPTVLSSVRTDASRRADLRPVSFCVAPPSGASHFSAALTTLPQTPEASATGTCRAALTIQPNRRRKPKRPRLEPGRRHRRRPAGCTNRADAPRGALNGGYPPRPPARPLPGHTGQPLHDSRQRRTLDPPQGRKHRTVGQPGQRKSVAASPCADIPKNNNGWLTPFSLTKRWFETILAIVGLLIPKAGERPGR
jgi:hypothetical protein